ncbi:hypothetical protein DUT90_11980 [Polaribacter sp. WD7]|uniref:hypothetical protein n=1 Tax=Polaribacter sp. WD7 TaxID=2269061 RepID=UPI000DF13BAC|nr:hypothetical protein [Polaribacter sp. WD7]RCS26470.1 hypothetical protein DUT90_11980 [Polaribacter sp. WD7]
MDKFKATYTDVTDWDVIVYQNTTGSRSKKIIREPETEDEYFFKGSKELADGEIRYPSEFWSEIVSSKIGQYLKFNILDYNIGYNKDGTQKIGCLSKSMVLNSKNKLTEGKVYLTGYKSSYNPEKDKKEYTFQFIRDTLSFFNYSNYIKNLLEIIVFDALIGNSDRHQENWGIITNFEQTIEDFNEKIRNTNDRWYKNWGLKLGRLLTIIQSEKFKRNTKKFKKTDLLIESDIVKNYFSPIYDSGCCLGREYNLEKVGKMITDNQMIAKYLKNGTSEIHWLGKKLNHFDLISRLKEEYPEQIKKLIYKIEVNFNEKNINEIIQNIDQNLPIQLKKHKLHPLRKELMIKLINLRFNKLLELK